MFSFRGIVASCARYGADETRKVQRHVDERQRVLRARVAWLPCETKGNVNKLDCKARKTVVKAG